MVPKLSRSLIIALALIAAGSFALAMYLENFELEFLLRHPISVNLISGVIAFSTAALVVSIGFNWWRRVDRRLSYTRAAGLVGAISERWRARIDTRQGGSELVREWSSKADRDVKRVSAILSSLEERGLALSEKLYEAHRELLDAGSAVLNNRDIEQVDATRAAVARVLTKLDYELIMSSRHVASDHGGGTLGSRP